jgi:AAA domain
VPARFLHWDVETQSAANLKKVGQWHYARHPSTRVWCVCFAFDDEAVETWIPGTPIPEKIRQAAAFGAHNSAFELAIAQHVLGPQFGWPVPSIEQTFCTMGAARACALPGSLEGATAALGLPLRKDVEGRKIMLRLAKAGAKTPTEEELQALYRYCAQDVEIERQLHRHLPPLSDTERAIWIVDQEINRRGFFTDRPLAVALLDVVAAEKESINAELATLTNGEIKTTGQVAKITEFVRDRGHQLATLGKRSVSAVLAHEPGEEVRRILELRRAGGSAAAGKAKSLLTVIDDDDRVRGSLTFHAASTGRWGGKGFQPQNLKKPEMKDVDAACAALLSRDIDRVRALGLPLAIAGDVSRALICAPPGRVLIGADLSAIESRIVAWLAGETWKIKNYEEFDRTGDPKLEPYCVTASRMLGHTVTPDDEEDRALGKVADLAWSFGGGVPAWRKFRPDDPRSDEEIDRDKRAWREAHPKIKKFWKRLEGTMISAVRLPGRRFTCGKISAEMRDGTLWVTLPSERRIAYPQAVLVPGKFEGQTVIGFKDNANGKWEDVKSWYGTLVENVVQATARDVMAAAMLRLESRGYALCLHCHDELVAETSEDFGSVEEFVAIMITPPDWAAGLPIAAKGWSRRRYGKSETKPISEAPEAVSEIQEPEEEPTEEEVSATLVENSLPAKFLLDVFGETTEGPIYLTSLKNSDRVDENEPGERATKTRNAARINAFAQKWDRPGRALYFCVSTVQAGKARAKKNLQELTGLHADIDFRDIEGGSETVVRAIEGLKISPSMTVSSGNGLHLYYLFRESLAAEKDSIAVVEGLLRKLCQVVAGDPAVCEVARLMRLPGTHNSKGGAWKDVEVLIDRAATSRYTIKELSEWLTSAEPVLRYKPSAAEPAKANGHDPGAENPFLIYAAEAPRPPIDVEARLACMQYQGVGDTAIHKTQLSVTASLLNQGLLIDEVVDKVIDATIKSAGRAGDSWDWNKEEQVVRRMCEDWQTKHPEIDERREKAGAGTEQLKKQKSANSTSGLGAILKSAKASTYELHALDWLWLDRFALGKLGLLVGLPDEGKGQIFADMAARVTRELEWPCNEGVAPQGNVILLSAEDAPNDTVVPRLLAAGADLNRVEIASMVSVGNKDRMFSLNTDLVLLKQKIIAVSDVKLVLIDPISAYLGVGKMDTFRTNDVRAVLAPVVDLAAELAVAFVGIMHFNKKIDVTNALLRISDRLAFRATARHVYGVIDDPENNRKLVVRAKNNLAARGTNKTLTFTFNEKKVGVDPRNGKEIFAPHVVWGQEYVDVTASEAMQAATESRSPTVRDEAKGLLRELRTDAG